MTIPEAGQLVLQAGHPGRAPGGCSPWTWASRCTSSTWPGTWPASPGSPPGVDIDIQFTGARPGEKFFEELFTDGEDRKAQVHPKVFEAAQDPTRPGPAGAGTCGACRQAPGLPEGFRQREMLGWFMKLVPVYRPSPSGLGRYLQDAGPRAPPEARRPPRAGWPDPGWPDPGQPTRRPDLRVEPCSSPGPFPPACATPCAVRCDTPAWPGLAAAGMTLLLPNQLPVRGQDPFGRRPRRGRLRPAHRGMGAHRPAGDPGQQGGRPDRHLCRHPARAGAWPSSCCCGSTHYGRSALAVRPAAPGARAPCWTTWAPANVDRALGPLRRLLRRGAGRQVGAADHQRRDHLPGTVPAGGAPGGGEPAGTSWWNSSQAPAQNKARFTQGRLEEVQGQLPELGRQFQRFQDANRNWETSPAPASASAAPG